MFKGKLAQFVRTTLFPLERGGEVESGLLECVLLSSSGEVRLTISGEMRFSAAGGAGSGQARSEGGSTGKGSSFFSSEASELSEEEL